MTPYVLLDNQVSSGREGRLTMRSSKELAPFGLPFWLDLKRPQYPQLNRNLSVDAVVIGAGIAGLKVARCLMRHGVTVVILEGSRVGEGASSRNQGTINHSAEMRYLACISSHSRKTAQELWELGFENHRLLYEQIDEFDIDCNYQREGSTTLVRRDVEGWKNLMISYREEYDRLREDGFDVTLLDETAAAEVAGNDQFAGGMCYNADAQFHSGKYVLGLAHGVSRLQGVQLYEGTRVRSVEPTGAVTRVVTNRGVVTAPLVFLATNALVPQFVSRLERSLRAERGQVFVTEPLDVRPCRGSFNTHRAWWREIIEPDGRFRLLFGGGRTRDDPDSLFPQFRPDGNPHPALETEGFRPSVAHQNRLEVEFGKLFPRFAKADITHRWGGLQSFTADSLPKIGMFDPERRIFGLAGFCGRGNCHSDVGAEYVVARALGVDSSLPERFVTLMETLMTVERPSAEWLPWPSAFDDAVTHHP